MNFSTSISNCIVIKTVDEHNAYEYLSAYMQCPEPSFSETSLTEYCHAHLPSYMIPSAFTILDHFPLNQNGKVDRKSLALIKPIVKDYIAPYSELEKHLVKIYRDSLNVEKIGLNDNFFLLGAHSILINQIKSKIEQSLKLHLSIQTFYENPTLSMLAEHCKNLLAEQKQEQQPNEQMVLPALIEHDESSRYEPFPVTEIQQAYLIGRSGHIELGHVSCFCYQEYDCPPKFDIERFEEGFNHLIQRHETLRIVFSSETQQKILKNVPHYTISIFDINEVMPVEEQLLKRRSQLSHQIRPIDQWPLFDIQLTRFIIDNEYQFRLHVGVDLLIVDLWSLNMILYELNQLYLNANTVLTPFNLSYRDYILAEHQIKDLPIYRNDKQYWIDRLGSFPLGPNLPLRCLPNELQKQRFHRLKQTLDRSVWQSLKNRLTNLQLSPAGFLASVYAIVLARWSEDKHFSLNLPIFYRLPIHRQVNQIAGDFTSVILLEVDLNQPITFDQFVHTVQKQLWNDIEHMSYNGVSFIRQLMQTQNTRQIILPIIFTCGIDTSEANSNNRNTNILFDQPAVFGITQTPQIFLDNQVHEHDGQLLIHWDHVENLFPPNMINDMHHTFTNMLTSLALSDEIWQKTITVSLSPDQQLRRHIFLQTNWETPAKHKTLHALVNEQAERTPDAWAVLSSRGNLTYKQLMNRAYSLAYQLEQQGAQSNQLIAILMEKGWEQIVACLAILLSGAAYLPLDIDSPHDRLSSLIQEADVKIILTESNYQSMFTHLIIISVDTFTNDLYPILFPIKQQLITDLAYVIYTSGSTGKPKGVMINHQAVINTILDMNSRLEISTEDRIFALSHLNFDLSVFDIFGMLTSGGAIVIPDHQHYKDPKHWYELLIEHRITIWNSVPMLMQMLVEHLKECCSKNHLRHILLSGDWIPLSLPKSIEMTFGEQAIITSLGGATEASIWSIAYSIPKQIPTEWKSIPYGMPLRNQHYYVYDSHLNDCPEYVTGELYIGGIGLADGYWKDQVKTESSFINHPCTHERLYRTGDYGRFLPSGYIEFVGRKDFQVKLHGHRIELGEIEYNLDQHSDIHQAIVIVDNKSQRLIAYIMPEKHTAPKDDNQESNIFIIDPIERTNFKLARHGILHKDEVQKSYSLRKPEQTEALIDKYYTRKSYRQFTNETIKKSDIEYLLTKCSCNTIEKKAVKSLLNFNNLSEFLSMLTSINVSNEPLPKYRYASVESLYPVQVYIEVFSSINDITPGLYYHNPDKHALEFIGECTNNHNGNIEIRLHLVGRSAAIFPLYGKKLGSQFCILETGYILGLLQHESSKMGWKLSNITQIKTREEQQLILEDNDTYCSFSITSIEPQFFANNNVKETNYPDCFVYLKTSDENKDQWFVYDIQNNILKTHCVKSDVKQEQAPLLFADDDETKVIFNNCQAAVFFVGESDQQLNSGTMAHLLMSAGLEINIGMCPIGSRINFPLNINNVLHEILSSYGANKDNKLLHILLVGKIDPKQKHARTVSAIKTIPDYSQTLKAYLNTKLPNYMIPSLFITLRKFPLNPNGKVDRKSLPEPSSLAFNLQKNYVAPNSDLEKTLVSIWQELLEIDRVELDNNDFEHDENSLFVPNISSNVDVQKNIPLNDSVKSDRKDIALVKFPSSNIMKKDRPDVSCNQSEDRLHAPLHDQSQRADVKISITESFFALGGHSLLLIKLYQRYQSVFGFDYQALAIGPFLRQATIAEHAKLLQTINVGNMKSQVWEPLHISEGKKHFVVSLL
ncbi:unnamed protein product [Rotaria sp. Silwood2]|nr:unnamed protein product [Rotaria sp. Silwood2]CAF4339521.1 unnamed protein product [Rotaria sp. Silwood2]